MKLLSVIFIALLAYQVSALPQDDSEPRAAPARGLLKRGLITKGKATTTTTTPAPQEDIEYEDEAEYPAEGDVQEPSSEAPPSSTEGKKLVAGGVRPFRSNTDLLETLKRRRAQAAEAKLHGHSSTTAVKDDSSTEAPVKANFSKKRVTATKESNNEETQPLSQKPSRRFGRPSSRSIQDQEQPEEQSNDASPPARTGRTFSRRGGY